MCIFIQSVYISPPSFHHKILKRVLNINLELKPKKQNPVYSNKGEAVPIPKGEGNYAKAKYAEYFLR